MIEANNDEVICPNCVTQFRAIPVNVQTELRQQEAAIERLENEAVAASIRMDNDAAEIARQKALHHDCAGQLRLALSERDEYQQAADSMAASHKVERDAQKIAGECLMREIDGLNTELMALKSSNESYITLANTAYELTEQRTAERDKLALELHDAINSRAETTQSLHGWVKENAPGGWIDNLRKERDALETHNAMLKAALRGVIKVADRKTDEFDAAKDALKQEHITDGRPCWCCPEVDYTDPDTGVSVIVHKEPQ